MFLFPFIKKELYPYRHGIAFGFFDGISWLIASATPMILLLSELGASAFQVGLAYSFGYLLIPLRVVSVALIPRLGYKCQVVLSWLTRTLLLLVPIGIALEAPSSSGGWMIWAMIGSFFIFCILRAVGCSSFFPWMYELLPERVTGRYFSMDQFAINIAGVIVLLFSSVLFYFFDNYDAFLMIYSVAMLASFGAIFSAFKIPSVKSPNVDVGRVMKGCKRLLKGRSAFKYYLLVLMIWFFVGIPYIPFKIYYLSEVVGVDEGVVVIYMAVQYMGSIVMAWYMRGWVDHVGVRPFMLGSLLTCVVGKVYWFYMVLGWGMLLDWVVGLFFLNGISMTMWQIAHHKYAPQLFIKRDRALGVALLNASVGVVGGIAPIVWGYFLGRGGMMALNEYVFLVYFFVAAVVMSGLLIPFSFIRESWPGYSGLVNTRGMITR